jgi:hypothetical protein
MAWKNPNSPEHRQYMTDWRKKNRSKTRGYNKTRRVNLKVTALTHYGPVGVMKCSWTGCEVDDPDMLSLDHVNNDGADDRKVRGRRGSGYQLYFELKKENFPAGYQTLCYNHQAKKELVRRREA